MLVIAGILMVAGVLYYLNETAGVVFAVVALGLMAYLAPRIMRRTKAAIVLREEFGFSLPDRMQAHLNDVEADLRKFGANEYEIAATFMALVLKDPARVGLEKDLDLEMRCFTRSTGLILAGKVRPQIANSLNELLAQIER